MKMIHLCLNSPILKPYKTKIHKFSNKKKKRTKDSPYQEMIPQNDINHIIFMNIEYSKLFRSDLVVKDTELIPYGESLYGAETERSPL